MSVAGVVVLDNEAVAALVDVRHSKHRRVLAVVEAAIMRRGTRRARSMLVVPTSVRVEANWNRRAPGASAISQLKVLDHALDGQTADRAASIRAALDVSVADAHLGAVLGAADTRIAVVTSDVDDVERMSAFVGCSPVIVRV